MFTALSPGAIGVRPADLEAAVDAAVRGGFEGVEFNAAEIADLIDAHGAPHVRTIFDRAGIRVAGWGFPLEWRGSEERWREGLDKLPRRAQAAAAIGGTRCYTWITPSSDERPFEENWQFHVERLAPAAQILAASGCRLGLEFIGPKTLRDAARFPFVYRMQDMLELGAAVGSNVGLLLDCWHWYTSGGTTEELHALRPEQIVYVHVNDAPAGVPVDEQLDNVRALPGETGVIDIAGFLQALQVVGYDGPVVPEPFKKELNDLPSDDARLEIVGSAMKAIFRQAGIR
ncbi:MAG TPA: sugar phosphate isomerase/epimerase family protein [Herpetosiphonaceae bacterium]|nr:sugar phosphate isomerase/epimerase family protein [Herpetosiphonaceae bacterium]